MAKRAALALWLAWAIAIAARAEIYRCEEPGRPPRFTSDPRGCARPVVHEPPRDRWVVVPAAPAADAPRTPPDPRAAAATLGALFPTPPARAWEVLTDPLQVPTEAEYALGLRASVARHYTRARGPISEVCTLEVWSFERLDQAERARAEVEQPTWWGRTAGPLLVLAHGVRLEREVGSRDGLVAGCAELADAAHARALATLPAGGKPP